MRYSIHSICDRLCERKKYVNSWTVLFVDILLSVGSSFVALLFVDNFIVDLSRNAYLFVIVGSFFDQSSRVYGVGGEQKYNSPCHHKKYREDGRCDLF